MKVLVFTNPSRDVSGEFTERAVNALKSISDVTVCNDLETLPNDFYEYVVALGGDGTILRAAPYAAQAGAAVLGINIGGVGYLSAFGRDEIEYGLPQIIDGKLEVENRLLLDVSGTLVVNEAVIYRGLNPRPIKLNIQVTCGKQNHLRTVKGDGLIIATPTGSTAYSLCAGGKAEAANSDNILYTPICAENSEPEVFRAVDEIKVTLEDDGTAALSLDGNMPKMINPGDSVIIKKADKVLRLVKRKQ